MRGARAPYDLSYVLGQGDAPVMVRFALYCAMTGRHTEAVQAMARALELDPLNPQVHRGMGIVLYNARRYADAIPRVAQALAMNPKMADAHSIIGNALFVLARNEEARTEYLAEGSSRLRLQGLAVVERKLGNNPAAQSALDQLVAEHGDTALYQQAQVLAQWGELDSAVTLLLRARTLGDSGLIYARNDPMLDPLRQTPAFLRLLQELGFD
jgi:tetratricopeptide (TPR) repeat protein